MMLETLIKRGGHVPWRRWRRVVLIFLFLHVVVRVEILYNRGALRSIDRLSQHVQCMRSLRCCLRLGTHSRRGMPGGPSQNERMIWLQRDFFSGHSHSWRAEVLSRILAPRQSAARIPLQISVCFSYGIVHGTFMEGDFL